MNKLNKNKEQLVEKIKYYLEFIGDGGCNPMTKEDEEQIYAFLDELTHREQVFIDEDELNNLASEHAIKADVEAQSMIVNQGMPESTARFNVVCEAYKAGYNESLHLLYKIN